MRQATTTKSEKETKQTQNTLIMGFQSKSHQYLVLRLHVCQKLPRILECMQRFLTAAPKRQHTLCALAIREIQRKVMIFWTMKMCVHGYGKKRILYASMFWKILLALDITSKLLSYAATAVINIVSDSLNLRWKWKKGIMSCHGFVVSISTCVNVLP
jgi:hypothetical protein